MRPALPVALAVLAMGAASTAQAGDPDENYADYSADCALLNTALGQDATRDRAEGLFHQFVAGFVSGYNIAKPDTWDIVGADGDIKAIVKAATDICRERPDETWGTATNQVLRARYDARLKSAPPDAPQ